ncbi:MAG TPA: flavodoxin family protein [Candidatus Copromorpha excrementigallinarum]|uniref:Flavodoxin family protein n=1 Tax=Candidatus Allocopromorpha excrementigallinarum TaxID=2840742 RepID=A0A9D1L7R6_9FIRM|nr:flavodoxin family protein [Candidatus Copromorpha excrementigallinarum]
MRYLILNGSPKGEKSITMLSAAEFVKGIKSEEPQAHIDTVHLAERNIVPCRSCYACWSHISEGRCVMTRRNIDDMPQLMELYEKADRFILVTPMHFFAISSYLQKFLERTFPLIKAVYLPLEGRDRQDDSMCSDMSTRDMAVIATCKVYFDGVWNSIHEQMSLISRRKYQGIFSTQPLPASEETKKYAEAFFQAVREAGRDFAAEGKFSDRSREMLYEAAESMRRNINTANVGL